MLRSCHSGQLTAEADYRIFIACPRQGTRCELPRRMAFRALSVVQQHGYLACSSMCASLKSKVPAHVTAV